MLHKQQMILLHRKLLLNWFRVIAKVIDPVVAAHVQRIYLALTIVVVQKRENTDVISDNLMDDIDEDENEY